MLELVDESELAGVHSFAEVVQMTAEVVVRKIAGEVAHSSVVEVDQSFVEVVVHRIVEV